MKIIEAKNINYSISNKNIFNNLSLDIEKGSFVCITGNNSVGKTTLLKLLSGKIITDLNIKINNVQVNNFNIEEISKKIQFINSYNEFFSKTVIEEILQDKRSISIFEVNKVRKLLDEFDFLYLEKMSVQDLSYAENQIVALIKAIVNKPNIIILDNAFSKLDLDKRRELISYLKTYAKNNDITIIFSTNNIDDLKFSDRIILLKYSNIFFDGDYESFIKEVDLSKEGIKPLWAEEVSDKLILYDLIDKKLDDINLIVGELCK